MWLSRPTENFADIMFTQLHAYDTHYLQCWAEKDILEKLLQFGIQETNINFPEYFNKKNKCYHHKLEALKFLFKVKIFAQTNKNNKNRKQLAKSIKEGAKKAANNRKKANKVVKNKKEIQTKKGVKDFAKKLVKNRKLNIVQNS